MQQDYADEEQVHFAKVISTFKAYGRYSLSANNRRRKDFYSLALPDQEILSELGYKTKLDEVDAAIQANAQFLNQVVADPDIFGADDEPKETTGNEEPVSDRQFVSENSNSHHEGGHPHGNSHSHTHGSFSKNRNKPTEFDMDKLRSTLKQFVRDWSGEGKIERDACYTPMKDALAEHFSDIPPSERRNFRVLVPGAGLGRLAYDVAKMGFACQGNEFSHYMLLASFFMLNRTEAVNKYTIYPYVHSFSNIDTKSAMLRPISIPDVLPSDLPPGSNFSLVAGDFEDIYGSESSDEPHSGQWDGILTCFFMDTAKNIVNYMRILHHILAPGGVWINLGPLLWHWENNNTNDPSIELDLEEVKALARAVGFTISNERTIDTTYTNNSRGMLGYIYHAAFWTATKVI